MNVSFGLAAGFIVGAAVGFLWAQGTRSHVASNTETTVDGEAVTVRVKYRQAAIAGLRDAIGF